MGCLLEQLSYGKLVGVEIMFCNCEEMDIGMFNFSTKVAKLDCLFLEIDSVDVDKIHPSDV